jgi:hypothetical protein
MSDERFTQDPDDEANANDPEHPYIDRPLAGRVRPAATQPDHRGPPTPEEIEAFIAKEFGDSDPKRKKPKDWRPQ